MPRFIFIFLLAAAALVAQETPASAPTPETPTAATEASTTTAQSAQAPAPRRGVVMPGARPQRPQSATNESAAPATPAQGEAQTPLSFTSQTAAQEMPPEQKPFSGTAELPIVGDLDLDEQVGPFLLVDEVGPQILSLYEQLTGKIILAQQTIPQVKINFNSRGTLSRRDAVAAIETLLTLNGISLMPLNDNFVKAVPTGGINTQSPEILMDKDIQTRLPSQTFYSRVFKLGTLTPTEAMPLLQPLLTAQPPGAATIVAFEKARALLVTDTLVNLQRMDRVIKQLDNAQDFENVVSFFPLRYAKASEVLARLQRMQGGIFKRSMSNVSTSFEADDRTNQLMVITDSENMETLRKIINGFDVDIDPLTRSEVFYIQQADAKELADVLKQLVSGQQQATKQTQTQQQQNARNAQATATRSGQQVRVNTAASTAIAAAPRAELIPNLFGDENNSFQFSQFVTIVPDERSNSIVVYGTPTDIKQVKGVIDQMDISRLQVRVEVIITEVTLTNQQVSGLENFQLKGVDINRSDWRIDASGKTPVMGNASSPAFEFSLEDYTLNMVFNVAKRDSNVKVLSAPSITTTHNEKGSISMFEERPRVTSSTTNTDASSGSSNQVTQAIEWKKIGIELELDNIRVGPNGNIQMEITQRVSDTIESQMVGGVQTPIVSTREAKSFVTARDGQVVVLGGLQTITNNQSDGRVTFWGSIPLLGNLFRPQTSEIKRRELIFFLRPVIIQSARMEDVYTQRTVKNSGALEDLKEYDELGVFRTPNEREEAKRKAEEEAKKAQQSQDSARQPAKRVKRGGPHS